ncbi:MAG: L,D-transpeptidase [Mycobacteriales bacterium]
MSGRRVLAAGLVVLGLVFAVATVAMTRGPARPSAPRRVASRIHLDPAGAAPRESTATGPEPSASAVPAPPPAAPLAAPSPPAAPAVPGPVAVTTGDATQVLTVAASGTYATVQAWELRDGAWHRPFGSMSARVGKEGVTDQPSEWLQATPTGTYTITQLFGGQPDPGVKMPYRRVGPNDYWVSDVHSPDYNTWQTCAANCPFDTNIGEHLADYTDLGYRYGAIIDFNQDPVVPGRGSAIFLHVGGEWASAGCITLHEDDVLTILRWLNPNAHPRIAIGSS